MHSVADDLRREVRERMLALSPGERIAVAIRLAESDLDLCCSARQIRRDEARQLLVRARQAGRRPSRVTEAAAS